MATILQAHAEPATWRDYLELTKPRVVLLMLITSLVGMFLATRAGVPWTVLLFGNLGIGLCAGAAAAVNHVVDRRIDSIMARTHKRPVTAGRVSPAAALTFALLLAIAGMSLLLLFTNELAAWLTLASLLGYAVIYTGFLKRATPQNIVIGGLAGALPPAIAWAAKAGSLSIDPILMVAIIFFWTPPHFWALSLLQKNDYAAARVPMLPVTHGAKATRFQIFAYSLLLAPLAVTPVLTGLGGMIYGAIAALGGAFFIFLATRVLMSRAGEGIQGEDKRARDLFGFSILYLFALFAALLAERGFA